MSSNTNVTNWATGHGFSAPIVFDGLNTTVGTNPKARYAGFYLLGFADGDWYLGESVNVRSRMGQHKKTYGSEVTTVRLLLQNLSKAGLRAHERTLIRELNEVAAGNVRNKAHAGVTAGVNELVEFLDEDEQQLWLENPRQFNATDDASLKAVSAAQEAKYKTNVRKFRERPDSAQLTGLLRLYLEAAVPAPRRTEFQSWNVSCGTYNGVRVYCVSVGKMEVFVTFADGGGFVVVRKSLLGNLSTIRKRHPDVRVGTSRPYEDSGPDMARLRADSYETLHALLEDPIVQQAAAKMVLDVTRKHPSAYARYHCTQLVEDVYPEFQRPAAEASMPATEAAQIVRELMTELPVTNSDSPPEQVFDQPDDVPLAWFVNAGPVKSGRNSIDDFIGQGEWRMDPNDRYQDNVQDMLPGERIAVRKRYNSKQNIPFDHRGNHVSCMDILLTGTVTENPGDGVSVKVDWDLKRSPRTWYLFTSQDMVWPVSPIHSWSKRLIDFAFSGAPQDLDFWRNASYWRDRFGDVRR